jgi:hypothetical protein
MSELAFNIQGEPFELPSKATNWRVRRIKAKGAPEVVYGNSGMPLLLPADADLDDLRTEVEGVPGRYRLDAMDANHRPIEGASGYVMVHATTRVLSSSSPAPTYSSDVVMEAMRMNSELAKSVIDNFASMVDSAAGLLRAADGAGLQHRKAIELLQEETDDDDDDDDDVPNGQREPFDLQTIVAQLIPIVMASLTGRKKLAAPEVTVAPALSAMPVKDAVIKPAAAEPILNAQALAHIAAIQAALTPEEAALARSVAQDLAPADLRAWFGELSALSVPQAVARVRGMLQPSEAA